MLRTALMAVMMLAWPAMGAVVENLYQGRVVIENQGVNARRDAMRDALQQVLVKVRGQEDILAHPEIRRQITNADELLSQYRFEQGRERLYYLANFDVDKVNQLIRSNGFPVWGRRRPATLIWLAKVDEDGQRRLVTPQDNPQLVSAIREQARIRGIAVQFPLFDLTDLERVGALDVWGRFIEHIHHASQRYQAQVVFSARIYQQSMDPEEAREPSQPKDWRADWNMALEETFLNDFLVSQGPQEVVRNLVDEIAHQMSERYASIQSRGGENTLIMTFENVTNLQRYVGISRVLSSLSIVSGVSLKHIQGQQASYEVTLLGTKQDLLQSLSLEPSIKRLQDSFGQPVSDNRFVWVSDD